MSEAIYTARCEQAWDGDSFGNEWECGASVYAAHDAKTFKVYEDDGSGNGDKLAEFDSAFVARQYADLYVRFLDAGGYSGSPEAIDMARMVEDYGVKEVST